MESQGSRHETEKGEKEIEQIKQEVDYYEKVRGEVKMASGDYVDLKLYEPAMRHLIDSMIRLTTMAKTVPLLP